VTEQSSERAMLMTGNRVGLALMPAEDVPIIARWNQDLEFTALLGTPGETHTLEMNCLLITSSMGHTAMVRCRRASALAANHWAA
jgi:hypothetical protein